MIPTIKSQFKNTYHKDGTVSYWNVYTQQWERDEASQISDKILTTMNQKERSKIQKMI